MRKRLEEAACKITNDIIGERPQEIYCNAIEKGAKRGIELGYKEAIQQAKEWLKDNEHFYQGGSERYPELLSMFDTTQEMLADFEEAMNKLWEEQK